MSALTLADAVSRKVAIEWHEGVAVVRDTIDRLTPSAERSAVAPELDDVELRPEGRVEVTGGRASDEPVRRLGQLLQALLLDSEPPVQLRLVALQATAAQPAYASLHELDDALAYFERPHRASLLQALYNRVAAAAPAGSASSTLDVIVPLVSADSTRESKRRSAAPTAREALRLGLGLAICSGLVVAGVAFVRSGDAAALRRSQAGVLADKASDAVGVAMLKGASVISNRMGAGRIVAGAEAAPLAEAAPPPAAVVLRPTAGPRQPVRAPTRPILVAFDLDRPPAAVPEPREWAVRDAPSAVPMPVDEPPPVDGSITYSAVSEGVSPPVSVRPVLPRELPPSVAPEDLGRIELVIAADGSVESVRLLEGRRNVLDVMFLSAAKAWLFDPARKEGVPVRYRKTIWIAWQ